MLKYFFHGVLNDPQLNEISEEVWGWVMCARQVGWHHTMKKKQWNPASPWHLMRFGYSHTRHSVVIDMTKSSRYHEICWMWYQVGNAKNLENTGSLNNRENIAFCANIKWVDVIHWKVPPSPACRQFLGESYKLISRQEAVLVVQWCLIVELHSFAPQFSEVKYLWQVTRRHVCAAGCVRRSASTALQVRWIGELSLCTYQLLPKQTARYFEDLSLHSSCTETCSMG